MLTSQQRTENELGLDIFKDNPYNAAALRFLIFVLIKFINCHKDGHAVLASCRNRLDIFVKLLHKCNWKKMKRLGA